MRFQQITKDVDSLRTRRVDPRPFIVHTACCKRRCPGISVCCAGGENHNSLGKNLSRCVQICAWLVQFGYTELQPLH